MPLKFSYCKYGPKNRGCTHIGPALSAGAAYQSLLQGSAGDQRFSGSIPIPVIDCYAQFLFAAQVTLCCLDRDVSEQGLNLIAFAAGGDRAWRNSA